MFIDFNQWQMIALFLIGAVNVYTFLLYYIDKKRAIHHQRRIPEKKLLTASFLLGGVGAALSMAIFRHKTQKFKFKVSAILSTVLTLFVLYIIIFR